MPHYGGASPSPRYYGGGPAQPNRPLLQVVWESLANQRGSAYDQVWPPRTLVGIENMAFARAITYDLYGANQRVANNFLPSKMTALLPRWESIFDVPPLPGDALPTRRGRVAAAFARVGQPNSVQPVTDVIAAALGPIFVGLVHSTPSTALSWWPGNSGTAGAVTSTSGRNMVVGGLTNVPAAMVRNRITLANCANAVNDGTFISMSGTSTTVTALNPSAAAPDYGIGGTVGAPTIQWSISNPYSYWSSSVDHIGIQVQIPAGYGVPGVAYPNPSALWWQTIYTMNLQLDSMLPSWVTWAVWMNSSRGTRGFRLDEKNLDVEAFGS